MFGSAAVVQGLACAPFDDVGSVHFSVVEYDFLAGAGLTVEIDDKFLHRVIHHQLLRKIVQGPYGVFHIVGVAVLVYV